MNRLGTLILSLLLVAFIAAPIFAQSTDRSDMSSTQSQAGSVNRSDSGSNRDMSSGSASSNKSAAADQSSASKQNAASNQGSSSAMSQSGANQKNANQRDQFSAMGPQRISMIMGQSIKNVDGQDLGKVEDVVIDQNGKITYVILSHGGFLGIGDKLVPIPWNSIAAHGNATQNRNYLMVDMSKDMIEKAPNFETKSWPNFAEGDWSNSVSSYFSRDSWNKDSSSKNAEMKSNSGSNLADRNYSKDTNFNSSTSGSTAVNSDDAAKKAGNTGTPASRGLTESR